MSEKKAVAEDTNNGNGRLFGGWTDIIILGIAITPSVILYYELTKLKNKCEAWENRLVAVEDAVFLKTQTGEKIPITGSVMALQTQVNSLNKLITELNKANVSMNKQMKKLKGDLKKSLIWVAENSSAQTSKKSSLSHSKSLKSGKLAIPDDEDSDEEEENPEDALISEFNEQVVE